MSSWCHMLPEEYVFYKDKVVFFPKIKIISHDVKVLKSEHRKILFLFITCILFL